MKNYKANKAFTLAETLIVIAVLGIVAMLTVPNVIRQHMEAVARTKIKKSMTVYDLAITKMTVENDLRSDTELIKWSNEVDNCGNTVAYFKTANNKSCEFKTSDGVWWDISDIMNPIIALSEDELHTAQAEGINGKTSFKLVASFDRQSGAFRVDDIGYEKLKLEAQLALAEEEDKQEVEDNVEELELLFGFIDNKKDDEAEDNGDYYNTIAKKKCGDDEYGYGYGYYCDLFNANGDYLGQIYGCDANWNNCLESDKYEFNGNGKVTNYYYGCDGSRNNCPGSYKYEYDSNGNNTANYYGCDGSGNNCNESVKYEFDSNGNQTVSYYGCDGSGNNCYESYKYEYDSNGNQTAEYYGCDGSGIRCGSCLGSSCPPKNSHGYYDPEDTVYDD